MATNDERHQMIEYSVLRRPEAIVDDSILLWERLAVELVGIIGHSGFHTIYLRSVHVTRAQYPWLLEGADTQFEKLKTSLGQQAPAQAGAANIALLNIFTGTLIQLIGASLTTAILHSAWGQDAVDTVAKGTHDEQ